MDHSMLTDSRSIRQPLNQQNGSPVSHNATKHALYPFLAHEGDPLIQKTLLLTGCGDGFGRERRRRLRDETSSSAKASPLWAKALPSSAKASPPRQRERRTHRGTDILTHERGTRFLDEQSS
jgi:hypothetical protein